MLELFLSAFITLFVVLDPPGCAPIYAGLTSGASPAQKRSMAIRACVIAGAILLLLALLAAGPLMKLVGARVEAVITRLLGVLLAALAAQYVFDGIRGSFGL